MKVKAGVWIDHKKALLIIFEDNKEKKILVESGIDKVIAPATRLHSGNPYGRGKSRAEDISERDLKNHQDKYLRSVIPYLKGVASILLFGPGQTKKDFGKLIEKSDLQTKIIAVETADRMTDAQFAAKVRKRLVIKPA